MAPGATRELVWQCGSTAAPPFPVCGLSAPPFPWKSRISQEKLRLATRSSRLDLGHNWTDSRSAISPMT